MKPILYSIFLFSICLLTESCNPEKRAERKNGPKLPVATLTTKSTDLYKHYVGDLNAYQNVEIRARVQGYLEEIYVDEGRHVKKGQPLFRLSDKEFKAGQSQAVANLQKAIAQALSQKLEVDRKRPLVVKGIISSTELEVAEAEYQAVLANVERAKSELANAETKLTYTFLRAPFDGITDRNPFKVGSLINEGTLLTTVSDIEHINAYFNIPERDYLEYVKTIENGGKLRERDITLILADGSRYPYPGKLEKQDGVFNDNTGTIDFRARFPNPGKRLKHGSAGIIQIANHIDNALLVPQKATFEIQDKTYVFVVDSTEHVKMKCFVPQKRFSDFYIVASGLQPGERIVYEGVQKIKDGMKIVPEPIDLDTVITPKVPGQLAQKP